MKRNSILILLTLLISPVSWATDTLRDTIKVVDVEEIVVIASPKENRKLRELPTSSTLLSQKDMQANQINSVKSLTAIVPNIFIPDYGSRLTTSIYIRGIGSRINTPAVGVYVDNIPFIDKAAFDFSYSDIERIDVLRGPQGTLYGRNTMGGLLRIHTKSPFSYQGTDVLLSAATYNDYKAAVTHYHQTSEQFAFSTGFFYNHNGGFFKNTYNNQRIDKADQAGGRFRGIYLPRENLKLDFTINYEYNNQGGYPYAYTGKVKGTETRPEYIGQISYNRESGYKRNLLNTGLNLEYQADNFILSSVTGYQFLDDCMDLDQDFTEQDIYTITQKQRSGTISQELAFKSKPNRRWQWTTGAFGFYQWLRTDAPVVFQSDGMDFLNKMTSTVSIPEFPAGPGMTMKLNFLDRIDGTSLPIDGLFHTPTLNGALFHQSTFNDLFGIEGMSFTAGLRLDYEHLYLRYNTGVNFTHNYSLTGTLKTPAMNREITMVPEQEFEVANRYEGKLDHDYMQLLPKFALQYSFNHGNSIYATVAKGYRSGGYNIQMFSDVLQNDMQRSMKKQVADVTIPALDKAPVPADKKEPIVQMLQSWQTITPTDVNNITLYKPEYSWSYEIGSHLTLFNGKLQADLAAFYMDTRDQQLSKFSESGLGRITVNAGKSRSYGGEISLRSSITNSLSVNANYGYTYATFTNYITNEKNQAGDLVEVSYDGKYVPFVPKHTLCAGIQYIFHIAPQHWLDRVQVNANYNAAGRIYWTEENNASQSFYGTLNGRVSLEKGKGAIAFWIRNALDKQYEAFYFESMGNGFMQKGRPMQIGVDVRCRF